MGNTRKKPEPKIEKPRRRGRPAATPEEREQEVALKVYDLVERQVDDGTASAQVLTHFLKSVSSRERLEQEGMARKNELLTAQVETLRSQVRIESLFEAALAAMSTYKGEELDDAYEG